MANAAVARADAKRVRMCVKVAGLRVWTDSITPRAWVVVAFDVGSDGGWVRELRQDCLAHHPAVRDFPGMARVVSGILLVLLGTSCASTRSTRAERVTPPTFEELNHKDVVRLIPPRVKDREGWAEDVLRALDDTQSGRSAVSVCSVLAIVEQESGYDANPTVPGLAALIQKRLDGYASKLGPLGRPLLSKLLSGRAPGHKKSFEERLKTVRTEKDVDLLFRQLLDHYERDYPNAAMAADLLGGMFASTHLEDLNPVTTAGSMQVSVRFAADLGRKRGKDTTEVRDELYTRRGGLLYGTARLLGYSAAYEDVTFRFADYNSGLYASRNAALQEQVNTLTGHTLPLDGDLLSYGRNGAPSDKPSRSMKALDAFRLRHVPTLSSSELWADARQEKSEDLEATETYRSVRRVYQQKTGRAPAYARMPQVAITGPKMSKARDTAWYARNVMLRYSACMKRHRGRLSS